MDSLDGADDGRRLKQKELEFNKEMHGHQESMLGEQFKGLDAVQSSCSEYEEEIRQQEDESSIKRFKGAALGNGKIKA